LKRASQESQLSDMAIFRTDLVISEAIYHIKQLDDRYLQRIYIDLVGVGEN